MSHCTRFEDEALAILEQGGLLDGHFSQCQDCQVAHKQFDRLKQLLQSLSETAKPSTDWQQSVWDKIDKFESTTKKRRWVYTAPFAIAASLALSFYLVLSTPSPQITLESVITTGTTIYRSSDVKQGDTITLKAEIAKSNYFSLRLYKNDNEIVLNCFDELSCVRDKNVISSSYTITSIGSYQPLLIYSEQPIPNSSVNLDQDIETVLSTGAEIVLDKTIRVR